MRIEIPQSACPITRIMVLTPQGVIDGEFTQDHKVFDVTLPEGVTEDEVRVTVEHLDNARAVIHSGVLKNAIQKPVLTAENFNDVARKLAEALDEQPDEGCECGPTEACSTCDPEDEIAEPKDEPSDE